MLPYLDPQYDYYVRAIAYQQTRQSWSQRFRIGDSLGAQFNLTPSKPETLWAKLPVKSYWRHGISRLAAFRLLGQYSLASRFAVFQLDPQRGISPPRGGGGMLASTFPLHARLEAPNPNPFSDNVHLTFFLNRPAKASLTIYDAAGRQVRTLAKGEFLSGAHHLTWNSKTSACGIYFAKLVTEDVAEVQKLVLTR